MSFLGGVCFPHSRCFSRLLGLTTPNRIKFISPPFSWIVHFFPSGTSGPLTKVEQYFVGKWGFPYFHFYWGTTSYPVLIFPYIFPKKHLHQPFGVAAGSPMTLGNLHVAGSKSMLRPRRSKSFPRWGSVFNLKCSDSGVADQTWVVELNISFIISLYLYICTFFVRKNNEFLHDWKVRGAVPILMQRIVRRWYPCLEQAEMPGIFAHIQWEGENPDHRRRQVTKQLLSEWLDRTRSYNYIIVPLVWKWWVNYASVCIYISTVDIGYVGS